MNGYSVSDAASVLGVPEGRVWELLARGVLSGTPEGDSMRVYLKAEPGPITATTPREEPPRANGNGGSPDGHGEASAFRELLTEFRNLTERYGQALLALGEARGEVAGLRSRVDLLETRLDLRVAAPLDAGSVAWQPPAPVAPAPIDEEPFAPPRPAPVRRAARGATRTPKSPTTKSRTPRSAVAGFAEAMARAQDPTVANLGDAGASAPESPAPESPAPESPAPTAVLDREAPPEAAPPQPEAAPTYTAAVVEPDWFADGDFAWLDAADAEARAGEEVTDDTPPLAESQLTPMVDAESFVGDVAPEPVDLATSEAAIEAIEPIETFAPAATEAADASPPPAATEVEAAAETEETARQLEPETAAGAWDPLETDPWSAADSARATAAEPSTSPLAMSEAELAQLARDEGWDDAEVAAIRAMISGPAAPVDLPGAAELDVAMAALHAVPVQSEADLAPTEAVPVPTEADLAPDREWAKPSSSDEPVGDEPAAYDEWAFEPEPPTPPIAAVETSAGARPAASEDDWVSRRRGPAATAYRRLRRLFRG